jgi:hypothetical protein
MLEGKKHPIKTWLATALVNNVDRKPKGMIRGMEMLRAGN